MWAFTKAGIFNFVEHPSDSSMILVKARVESHLKNLRDIVPSMGEVYFDPSRDYPYMADVTKEALADGMGALVMDIDYDKTKSAVGNLGGRVRNALLRVWQAVTEIEEDPKRINSYYNRDYREYEKARRREREPR
jgi:hypothetical protein